MTTRTQARDTEENVRVARGGKWPIYVILGLLFLTLVVSIWNARVLFNLNGQVLAAVSQRQGNDSGVFLTADGWQPGQVAPAVAVQTTDDEELSFAEVAAEHPVIYVAWDRCPICLEHFPELYRAAADVEAAGASFAMVVLLSEADEESAASDSTAGAKLKKLEETYGWNFPVFGIDQAGMLELNLQGTPTTLILRRGILGEAFASSSFERMTERMVAELGG